MSATAACTWRRRSRMSCPLRAWRLSSSPAVVPRPGISGRLNPNATRVGEPEELAIHPARMASSWSSFVVRSSHGLQQHEHRRRRWSGWRLSQEAQAAAGPRRCGRPAPCSRNPSIRCSTTLSVRCREAPSGSWIATTKKPLSSVGMNPLGTRRVEHEGERQHHREAARSVADARAPAHPADVAPRGPVEPVVEPAEEPVLRSRAGVSLSSTAQSAGVSVSATMPESTTATPA